MMSIKIYMIRPKSIASHLNGNAAYVWAHGGAAIYFNAGEFVHEMCRMAVDTQTIVFSVDYKHIRRGHLVGFDL